ncbi:MAG TPA: OmpA family protein [Vicinamibacterales bacterium]|nr:OmpA family protein [Vicinamibacterales bacterium]
MKRLLMAAVVLAFGVSGTTACATKGYVKNQVGQVSTKVDSLSQSLEATQERTRQNEAKIAEVDQKAQAGIQGVQQVAMTADGKAVAADGKASTALSTATAATEKAEAVAKSTSRVVYEVVLSEDSGNFKFGSTKLPDEGKAQLDAMIAKILSDPKGAYFEIEGHTDNVGGKEINKKIGMDRAEAVKWYLYEQHHIPLHRMAVVSYGEEKPTVENTNSKNRAQNRRVVIRVLN